MATLDEWKEAHEEAKKEAKEINKAIPFMQEAINELHRMFAFLNVEFFKGEELDIPIITIQNQGKMSAYGWCTVYPIWKDAENKIEKWELNLTAEYINRPWMDTAKTLLHEMVHYYNKVHGVKDVSRGTQYHNKKFKDEAEKRGLVVEKGEKVGWGRTPAWQDWAREIMEKYEANPEGFALARLPESAGGKKGKGKGGSSSIKMVCPSCGGIARITKEFRLKCGECDEYMEAEE